MEICPICGLEFDAASINAHVNDCLDSLDGTHNVAPAPAPASSTSPSSLDQTDDDIEASAVLAILKENIVAKAPPDSSSSLQLSASSSNADVSVSLQSLFDEVNSMPPPAPVPPPVPPREIPIRGWHSGTLEEAREALMRDIEGRRRSLDPIPVAQPSLLSFVAGGAPPPPPPPPPPRFKAKGWIPRINEPGHTPPVPSSSNTSLPNSASLYAPAVIVSSGPNRANLKACISSLHNDPQNSSPDVCFLFDSSEDMLFAHKAVLWYALTITFIISVQRSFYEVYAGI